VALRGRINAPNLTIEVTVKAPETMHSAPGSSKFAKATSRACDLQRIDTCFGSRQSQRILAPGPLPVGHPLSQRTRHNLLSTTSPK
jgi:hypothetical protein